MNIVESLNRSFRRGKSAFFERNSLNAALSLAVVLKSLCAPVVGEFNGTVGVIAVPKSEVM